MAELKVDSETAKILGNLERISDSLEELVEIVRAFKPKD